jgi:membrane dipeptidase
LRLRCTKAHIGASNEETLMHSRRDALLGLGAALGSAAYANNAHAAALPAHWPPYHQSLAIDGAGGPMLGFLQPDDPQIATELAAIRASGLTGCVLTMAPNGQFWMDDAAIARTRANIVNWNGIIERYPDYMLAVRNSADLSRARSENKLGVIYTFQGAEPLGEDVDRVAMWRDLGVRVIQLTHNRRNLVGDGSLEPGNAGLSNFGHRVVEKLNEQKMVVDLAHGAPRTITEGIAASTEPMLISHTGCRALAEHPRNVDDATLRALARKGGVAGIIFWPYLRVDTQPMAIDVIRHIEHAINVCGEDHVGLGTDGGVAPTERTPEFERDNREWVAYAVEDGIFQPGRSPDLYTFIPDLNTADRFDTLAAMLSQRGHSDARIAKILGGNFARVMTEVWG